MGKPTRTQRIAVSILTHLVGWVQRDPAGSRSVGGVEVSILTHLVGWVQRARKPVRWVVDASEFQSSPTWSGGCNLMPSLPGASVRGGVSILTHLVGWVQPDEASARTDNRDGVSILTHLVGWVQHGASVAELVEEIDVSILTHLVGWVQLGTCA